MTEPTLQEQLDYLVPQINYLTRVIGEYMSRQRSKHLSYADNAERQRELEQERRNMYDQLCQVAQALGYEYLPYPATPHWQAPSKALYLDYAPIPKGSKQ